MRAHEVPTHLQAEDKVLLGLTFPQIVAAAAVVGLAYGIWQQATFLVGYGRIAAAVVFAVMGLAGIVVRPGGRALPVVVIDLLRFALSPKRYEGAVTALMERPAPKTPPKAKGKTKKNRKLRVGLPFRCLSIVLAVSVLYASVGPLTVMAAAPPPVDNAQRLYIESWKVRGNRAEITVRAATSLTVQVTAQGDDYREMFRARDVLYRGERETYVVPLTAEHKGIHVLWNDALGNAGFRTLDRRNFPFPISPVETDDCEVTVSEIGWRPGRVTGRISNSCRTRAEEVVEATVLTDPDDPSRSVEQRLLLHASVADVTGTLHLAASGPGTNASRRIDFVRDEDSSFAMTVPERKGVYDASLRADLKSTRVIPLPDKVDLTHNEEGSWLANVPVIGRFAGFFEPVTAKLGAVWDPVYHTVSSTLSAVFGPVTRTLSATLRATWNPINQPVGATLSKTVGAIVSANVGATLSATVGATLSTTVGAIVSTVLGKELAATLSATLEKTVGAFLSTPVGKMLSATVGKLLKLSLGMMLSGTLAAWLTVKVGKWLTGKVSGWLSGTVGTWLSATVGTFLSRTVGATLSATFNKLVSTTVGKTVSTWVGGFTKTFSKWAGIILGWLNISVWVPSKKASGYAEGTASGYARGSDSKYASTVATEYASATAREYASKSVKRYASETATGYATGEETRYASKNVSEYAEGTASGYASETVSEYAEDTATKYVEDTASDYASKTVSEHVRGTASGHAEGTATGYASETVSEYASKDASKYAEGVASGYASTEVTIPGRTERRDVSERVTSPGQSREQTVSDTVRIPGRRAEKEVTDEVWVEGKEVEQEVEVEVVIPAFTSAEVTEQEPLVRYYRESRDTRFAFMSDDPYQPLPDPPEDSETPSEIEQYIRLIEKEDERDDADGEDDTNEFQDALDRMRDDRNRFELHPDERLALFSAVYIKWLDSLTIPLDAREVMEDRAGGVVSDRTYEMEDIPGEAIDAQDAFRELVGEELR